MAQWYHRNALKNTAPHNFTLSLVSAQPVAIQICTTMCKSRKRILELVSDPSSNGETMHNEIISYLSLLQGFVFCHNLDKNHASTQSSKLRHITSFKWSNSVTGTIEKQQDTIFELVSICYEYAIWLMKHASWIASQENVDMDSAKQVHSSLRRAAGVLTCIQTQWIEQLLEKPIQGSDLDPRVISAYVTTCQAEAQEVTIARAIELKHSASLISALANQTSQLFMAAVASVKPLDKKHYGKWLAYLQLKASVYESYAYCYLGENLLEQEKCGPAIRALEESEKHFNSAIKICREYGNLKMAVKNGMNAKIDEHLFFRKLRPLVTRIKDKCLRENGFIFHQIVPKDLPSLEMKATHGLVTPEDFSIPPINELWTSDAYLSFDLTRNITNDPKKNNKDTKKSSSSTKDVNKKDDPPVEEIKEKPTNSSKDQKNESGCSIQ
ncbi:hypothetical protein BLOT_016426 [Blomia tropicalis]|nr:hypothetical protein BLOT_016426 [Blomia tropicalis]